MDKAQERHDAAMKELRNRADAFGETCRTGLRLDPTTTAVLADDMFRALTAAYFKGVDDGGGNEREWHEAIGGCPR